MDRVFIRTVIVTIDEYSTPERLKESLKDLIGKDVYVGGEYMGRITNTWVCGDKALASFLLTFKVKV